MYIVSKNVDIVSVITGSDIDNFWTEIKRHRFSPLAPVLAPTQSETKLEFWVFGLGKKW